MTSKTLPCCLRCSVTTDIAATSRPRDLAATGWSPSQRGHAVVPPTVHGADAAAEPERASGIRAVGMTMCRDRPFGLLVTLPQGWLYGARPRQRRWLGEGGEER